jgi:hypothetical protein
MNKEQGNGSSGFALLMNEVHINFTKVNHFDFCLELWMLIEFGLLLLSVDVVFPILRQSFHIRAV